MTPSESLTISNQTKTINSETYLYIMEPSMPNNSISIKHFARKFYTGKNT